jgi:hypothetical protein
MPFPPAGRLSLGYSLRCCHLVAPPERYRGRGDLPEWTVPPAIGDTIEEFPIGVDMVGRPLGIYDVCRRGAGTSEFRAFSADPDVTSRLNDPTVALGPVPRWPQLTRCDANIVACTSGSSCRSLFPPEGVTRDRPVYRVGRISHTSHDLTAMRRDQTVHVGVGDRRHRHRRRVPE